MFYLWSGARLSIDDLALYIRKYGRPTSAKLVMCDACLRVLEADLRMQRSMRPYASATSRVVEAPRRNMPMICSLWEDDKLGPRRAF